MNIILINSVMTYFKVFFIIQSNVRAHISSAADGLKEQQSAGWKRLLSLMINQSRCLFHAARSPFVWRRQIKTIEAARRCVSTWLAMTFLHLQDRHKQGCVSFVWPDLKSIKGAQGSLINSKLFDCWLLIRASSSLGKAGMKPRGD